MRTMPRPKGGRGQKTDYGSKMIRVPEPLIEEVKRLKDEFYGSGSGDRDSSTLPDHQTALETAQSILKSKKSARVSLERLLAALYGQEVKL